MAVGPRLGFGSVVLVSFPFTDQSGAMKRPAVIVSCQEYSANRHDVVIMAITSQVPAPLGFGEAHVSDWKAAGLVKVSVFKPVFATIDQSSVVRPIGVLSAGDERTLRDTIARVIG